MQSNETPQHIPVRWGVLSAANIAVKRVAPAIVASSNGRLVAVGSRNPQRAQELFAFAPEIIIIVTMRASSTTLKLRRSTSPCRTVCTRNGQSKRYKQASMCCAKSLLPSLLSRV